MSFSVYRGERRLSDLTTRFFGRLRAADARRVSEALLAANPELEHMERVQPGRPITVPDIEGLRRRDDEVVTPRAELLEAARTQLAAYMERISASIDAQRNDIAATREALDSEELRRLLEETDEAREFHERIAHATEEREFAIRERETFLETLKSANEDMDALFPGSGRR